MCTFYLCPNKDWFTIYEGVLRAAMIMRNDTSCKIVGVGIVRIRMFDGTIRTLTDVRHVPKLKQNLISLSSLDLKSYRYIGEVEF